MPDVPEDQNGRVLPHDDLTITDEQRVIRHVHPSLYVEDEKAPGGRRVSSGAFSPNGIAFPGMSVDLEKDMQDASLDVLTFVPEGHGAVAIPVNCIRALTLLLGRSPTESNPHHAEVWRGVSGGNFSGSIKNKLKDSAIPLRVATQG